MNIEFPVLGFSKESVHLVSSSGELSTTTRLALKTGYFADLRVIDRKGHCARVCNVRRIRFLKPLRFGDYMGWLDMNPKCEISLEFESLPDVSLFEAKQLTFSCIEADRELWDEMIDLEEFEAEIKMAESFEQLFVTFRNVSGLNPTCNQRG